MSLSTINTVTEIIEPLPDNMQKQVLEHLKEYISDLLDENKWDKTFSDTQDQLAIVAKKMKNDIALGKASSMDLNQL